MRARAADACCTAARSCGLEQVGESATSQYLFGRAQPLDHRPRTPHGWLHLRGVSRHNLHDVSVDVPLCVLTAVTGVSGSGKSTLVTQVLAEVVRGHLGLVPEEPDEAQLEVDVQDASGVESFDRLVRVDQRPIGRTPRSNLATYTGMFDAVRKLYAATDEARARGYSAGRFSFNVPEGRCETCQGEGFVAVELLFLPGTYAPCPTCEGARYNAETLEVTYRGKNIAEVLALSVDAAATFLSAVPAASRSLETLREVGLGYLRLGQPATELSGGEAQRIKLATELQRARRGHALYLLDEPTAGLHPSDIALLLRQLHRLVDMRQHGRPRRARPGHDRHRRLGHRPRSGRWRRGRAGRRGGPTGQGGEGPPQRHRALSRGLARALLTTEARS